MTFDMQKAKEICMQDDNVALDYARKQALGEFNLKIIECNNVKEQLATWQQIAIDEHAEVLRIKQHNSPVGTDWREMAGKELGLQVKQGAGYLERLETDYLSWVREYYRDLGEDRAIDEAQAALEKIREG